MKGDLVGGLTASIIALPLALAFGIASGLGASAGLWGAIILGFFAALFGGTKTQISGPTGPMTVISASIVLLFKDDFSSIMSIFALAGAFQIIFGVLKIGGFVKYIPYPVISGFMSGIGIIIIILQLNPMLGQTSVGNVLTAVLSMPSALINTNILSLVLSLATLAILYLSPKKLAAIIPTPLIALFVLSPIAYFLDLNVATIGDIPRSMPSFALPLPDLAKLPIIIGYAAMLALLGSIDSLLTSLVADSITKTKHKSNQELIAQGLGNTIVSFFGALVGAGATMRTVVNVKSGGHSRLSGVFHSIFLVLILLIFADFVSFVPLAVLSGILIKVGIDILDYRLLKSLKDAPKEDLFVMVVVFLLTVFVDLIFAVGLGVVLSSLLLVSRITKASGVNIDEQTKQESEENRIEKNVRIISVTGAFFFGSTAKVLDFTKDIVDVKTLIIDISSVPFVDLSAIFALEEMIDSNLDKNVLLVLNSKQKQTKALKKIMAMLKGKIFETQKEALDFANKNTKGSN